MTCTQSAYTEAPRIRAATYWITQSPDSWLLKGALQPWKRHKVFILKKLVIHMILLSNDSIQKYHDTTTPRGAFCTPGDAGGGWNFFSHECAWRSKAGRRSTEHCVTKVMSSLWRLFLLRKHLRATKRPGKGQTFASLSLSSVRMSRALWSRRGW